MSTLCGLASPLCGLAHATRDFERGRRRRDCAGEGPGSVAGPSFVRALATSTRPRGLGHSPTRFPEEPLMNECMLRRTAHVTRPILPARHQQTISLGWSTAP